MIKSLLKKHATTLALAVAVSFIAAQSARAQLIAYDGFNYPDLSGIATSTGGDSSGWAFAWASSTAGSQLGTNTASGLTYGGLITDAGALQVGKPQPGSPVGTATAATPQRTLTDTLGNLAAANGGTLWLSFLMYNPVYPTNTPGSPYYRQSNLGFFSGGNSTAGGTEKADLGLPNGSATQAGNVWSAWGGTVAGGAANVSTVSAFSSSVQLVLVEMVVDNTTAVDTYYAWLNFNPALLGNNANAPSTATADVSSSGADLSSVNVLRFQAGGYNANGTNAFFTVDEVRLGDSFADVTPVPEPAIFGLAALGGLAFLALRRKQQ